MGVWGLRPQRGPGAEPWPSLIFERESGFQRHLVLVHLAILDAATRLHHLEPAEVPQRRRRLGDGIVDGLGDALARRADDLDDLIDRVRHFRFSLGCMPGRGAVALRRLAMPPGS